MATATGLALGLLLRQRRAVTPPGAGTTPGAQVDEDAPQQGSDGLGRVEVWVRSTPAGARVSRGDEDLGDTPARLLLAPEDRWTLTLSAHGYAPRTLRVSSALREVNVVLEPAAAVGADANSARPDPTGVGRPRVEGTHPAGAMTTPAGAPMDPGGAVEPTSPDRRTDNRDPWDDAP